MQKTSEADFADTINVCSQCGAFFDGGRMVMAQQKCMYEFNPKAVKSKCELHRFDKFEFVRRPVIREGRPVRDIFKQVEHKQAAE